MKDESKKNRRISLSDQNRSDLSDQNRYIHIYNLDRKGAPVCTWQESDKIIVDPFRLVLQDTCILYKLDETRIPHLDRLL